MAQLDAYDAGPNEEKVRISCAGGLPDIVGILHRAEGQGKGTQPKTVALMLHGILAHKNQTYHRGLAARLGAERHQDSFRYDLRGQGAETEGEWTMAGFDADVEDLERVVEWLKKEHGYDVNLIVAHSRGSLISSYYLSTRPIPRSLTQWVNVSGRYFMDRGGYFPGAAARPTNDEKAKGWDWKVRVAGRPVTRRVTLDGSKSFANWDISYIDKSFPQHIDVLTVHAADDLVVPVDDAHHYHALLSRRSPGTHALKVIPDGGHNYLSPWAEPTESIMAWLAEKDGGGEGGQAKAKAEVSSGGGGGGEDVAAVGAGVSGAAGVEVGRGGRGKL